MNYPWSPYFLIDNLTRIQLKKEKTMKFCGNCGNQIDDNAIFCPRCGARTNGDRSNAGGAYNQYGGHNPYGSYNPYGGTYPVYDTRPSKLISVIGFLSWQIGLILWLVFRRSRPGKSESAIKGTVAGAAFSMPVLGLVFWVLWKNDPTKGDYARIAQKAAVVGIIVYAALIAMSFILKLLGVSMDGYTLPYYNEAMALARTLTIGL